jgi:hypothetical protein
MNRPTSSSAPDTLSLTPSGTARLNETVEVFDGATLLGTATVNPDGTWTYALSGLNASSHSIRAILQSGNRPGSNTHSFTVIAAATPTISSIKNSAGAEIAHGGETFDTYVTVSGTATPNQSVEIFDGSNSKGTQSVNASGNWSTTLSGLSIGSHAIKAVAQYGSNPSSTIRSFSVAREVTPTIASIKDPQGNEIAEGAATFDTNITMTGTASPNQLVEIFDASASKGTHSVDVNGNWTRALTGLGVGRHTITAVGQYGSRPSSAIRSFSVEVANPTITSVKDSNGVAIPDGGTTTDPAITMTGSV